MLPLEPPEPWRAQHMLGTAVGRAAPLMHCIASRSLQAPSAARISGKSGRLITVLRTPHGELHALDFYCFHMGGRLGEGDLVEIEEVRRALDFLTLLTVLTRCPHPDTRLDPPSPSRYRWARGRSNALRMAGSSAQMARLSSSSMARRSSSSMRPAHPWD